MGLLLVFLLVLCVVLTRNIFFGRDDYLWLISIFGSLITHLFVYEFFGRIDFDPTLLLCQLHAMWILPWITIWQWRKRGLEKRLKEWILARKVAYQKIENRLKEWVLARKVAYQKSDRKILATARKRAIHLCKVIDGVEWSSVRENIKQLANVTLPQLLSYRQSLREAFERSVEIMKQGEIDKSEMAVKLLHKTRGENLWFQETLDRTNARIADSMATLLHIEMDVRRALLSRSEAELEAVKQKLAALNASVGQTSTLIQAADAEVSQDPVRQGQILAMRSHQ